MDVPTDPPARGPLATTLPVEPTRAVAGSGRDRAWKSVELAQRGKMVLDVATLDLEASERHLGLFHPTTWHFRHALEEARRAWDRLRVEYGRGALDAALAEPPRAVLTLGDPECPSAVLVPIGGKTYRVESVPGAVDAPVLWRLSRLVPPLEDGPYYAGRLAGGSVQCDCAEWIYQKSDAPEDPLCKHLAALEALGWL